MKTVQKLHNKKKDSKNYLTRSDTLSASTVFNLFE